MKIIGFTEIADSIKKKVVLGFVAILLIMSAVSILTVYGYSRFSTVIERTNSVNRLYEMIFNLRLNEKRILISSDEKIMRGVDSICLDITTTLKKIGTYNLDSDTRKVVDEMFIQNASFNEEFKSYVLLSRFKLDEEAKVDSLYMLIERAELHQIALSGRWVSPNKDMYNDILLNYTTARSGVYALREEQQKISKGCVESKTEDSIHKLVESVLAATLLIEQGVGEPLVKYAMKKINIDLRHYEQGLIRLCRLNSNIKKQYLTLNTLSKGLVSNAENVGIKQGHQLEKWNSITLQALVILVLLAILGGCVILYYFIKTISIDEKKRLDNEAAIENNRRLLDNIINNSKSLIYVKDLSRSYTLVNQNWCKQVGLTEADAIGKTGEALFLDGSMGLWNTYDKQVLNSGLPVQYEEEIEFKSGKRYYLSNKFGIRDVNGLIKAICTISTDVSDLKDALRALEKSRENYRNIVTNVPGIVYTCMMNDSRTMLFLSSGFEKVTGFESANFLEGTHSFTNLIYANDRERVLSIINKAVTRNHSYEVEYRIEDVSGEIRWLHEKGMAVPNPNLDGYALQGVMIDVTAQKEALSEVMMRDRFLEGVAEAVKELIVSHEANDAIQRSLRIVAQSAMVDHSFIFVNEQVVGNEFPTFSHLYEWQKDKINPVKREAVNKISFKEIGTRWYHTLADKKEVGGFKDDFLPEEQRMFELLGVQNLLLVPVFARDIFWGFIGFGNVDKGMPWVESHKSIFRAYTVTLGIAIAKENDAVLLKEALNTAEAATQAKSDFLARMSHEIRTPMNAIVGWTHLAIEKELNAGQSDYLRKIQSSSHALLGIINDILDFSKIEAGKLTIEHIDFDLEKVFDDLNSMVAFKAHEKGIDFLYVLHPDVPLNLVGDPLRLVQVLVNLANNAIKFTNRGEVLINVMVLTEEDNEVEILFDVKDTGIGIKPELQPQLFDSFSQADVSTTRKYGGTGLGLAICKRLSELMGGNVWVESEFGIGTSFYFTVKMGKNKSQKTVGLQVPSELIGKKVLLCDSHPVASYAIKEMLINLGFEVVLAQNSKSAIVDAIDNKSHGQIDFVIIDWLMVGHDEANAAEELNKHVNGSIPLIIMASPFLQSNDLRRFVKANDNVSLLYTSIYYSALFDACMTAFGKEQSQSSWRKKEPAIYMEELRSIQDVLVLLVEDNDTNKQIGIELLELAGLSVELASDGQEAVDIVSDRGKGYFDLILMDIQMPVMDGFDATRNILSSPDHENELIIAMTADAIGGIKEKYLECGMVDMIAKPIDPEQLFSTILHWVDKRRGTRPIKRKKKAVAKPSSTIQPFEITAEVEADDYPNLAGFNVEEGVRRFANRWDFFKRLLQRFYIDHLGFVDDFKKAREEDREVAERMLHSFKGISGTISAPKLYELAIATEAHYKNNNPEFSESFHKMSEELDFILEVLKNSPQVDVKGFKR